MTKTVEQLTKVEKGIPWPEADLKKFLSHKDRNKHRVHKRSLPFRQMEVGDSFLVPSTKTPDGARLLVNSMSHKLNKVFMVAYDAERRLRVWRVE